MISAITKVGDELVCLCPYPDHNDTKPSLNLNLRKNFYYCHGCRKGGKAEELIARFGDVTFIEFKGETQEFSGEELEPDECLTTGIEYMHLRGFTDETLKAFHIFYDNRKYRVVVPIIDRKGHVWGTVGRTVIDEEPRYKYSYGLDVKKNLLGLHTCLEMPTPVVHLVEGAFDAMWMWQCGYRPTLAIMGSRLYEDQADMLSLLTGKVVLCFDNDSAGKKAGKEAFHLLNSRGTVVYSIALPPGKNDIQDCLESEVRRTLDQAKRYSLIQMGR